MPTYAPTIAATARMVHRVDRHDEFDVIPEYSRQDRQAEFPAAEAGQSSQRPDRHAIEKGFHQSESSSLSATDLMWAYTRCPGFSASLTRDFRVMLATKGAPTSSFTSTVA